MKLIYAEISAEPMTPKVLKYLDSSTISFRIKGEGQVEYDQYG